MDASINPIPVWIPKEHAALTAQFVTGLLNFSLAEGYVPNAWIKVLVRPLLKKPGLDPEVVGNYRPITNLPVMAKLLEKLVVARLQEHLETNALWAMVQSGFLPTHRTETVLACVWDEILENSNTEYS